MKKTISYLLVVSFLLVSIGTLIPATLSKINDSNILSNPSIEKIVVTIQSPSYTITETENGEVIISMDEFGTILQPGYPKLPSKIYNIGLPEACQVTSINLLEKDSQQLPGSFMIKPAPFMYDKDGMLEILDDKSIYESNSPYPKNIYSFLGTGNYNNYYYAKIQFFPFTYIPLSKTLTLHKEIKLEIEYTTKQISEDSAIIDKNKDLYASQIIDNFQTIKPLYENQGFTLSSEIYDYVIITTEELENSVIFLSSWREITGYSPKIVNLSWITSSYSGIDVQEKIKNFLLDKHLEWGISHLIIVGSDKTIPMRDCYPDNNNHGYSGRVPTDYYFADLTGDWDADNDGYFGEKIDDDPDFVAEIYVGRIPVDDPVTVEKICQKIIKFEQTDEDWKQRALLIGALLWLDNEDHNTQYDKTDGADLMERVWYEILSQKGFERTSLYEKEGLSVSNYICDFPLTRENVRNQWMQGYGFVNWNGHGSPTSTHRLFWRYDDGDGTPEGGEKSSMLFINTLDPIYLDDEKPAIVFSCSCENAHPETKNLGTALIQNGAVAFIGASRNAYGAVGWKNVDDGGCSSLDYIFTKNLIGNQQACGEALYKGKVEYYTKYSWWGWETNQNMYGFNLYGDPATTFQAVTSYSPPSKPVASAAENTGVIISDLSFSSQANDLDNHPLYYQWSWGDGSFSTWQGPFSAGQTVQTINQWKKPGTYETKVRARDVSGMDSEWSEPITIEITAPSLKIESIKSGFGSVRVGIKNTGNAAAIDINWSINLREGVVLNKYSEGTIESLAPGRTTVVRNFFMFGMGLPVITVEIKSKRTDKQEEQTTGLVIGPLIIV